MSRFEDELAEIVRKQREVDGDTLPSELTEYFAEIMKDPKTYGYIVYINEDGEHSSSGLIPIHSGTEKNLSHAHRKADQLIDELFMHECEFEEDEDDGA